MHLAFSALWAAGGPVDTRGPGHIWQRTHFLALAYVLDVAISVTFS